MKNILLKNYCYKIFTWILQNPKQIAHKVLADRIGLREQGNKPGAGDRMNYAYIKNDNKKALQGKK